MSRLLSAMSNIFSGFWGNFVATVLGIVLTFGVSKLIDEHRRKQVIKQEIFNVITDIDNCLNSIERTEPYLNFVYHGSTQPENHGLPYFLYQYAQGNKINCDSAVQLINFFVDRKSYIIEYYPVGKDLLNPSAAVTEHEMEVYRIINLAYSTMDRVHNNFYARLEEYGKEIDNLHAELFYSRKFYTTQDQVDTYFQSPATMQLVHDMEDFLDNQQNNINSLSLLKWNIGYNRIRIMKYAGIKEEEYQAFLNKLKDADKRIKEEQDAKETDKE